MPAFGRTLDNREVAAVLTYIRNASTGVSANDVERHRDSLAKHGE